MWNPNNRSRWDLGQRKRVINETGRFLLDLRMTRVVPIDKRGTGELFEEELRNPVPTAVPRKPPSRFSMPSLIPRFSTFGDQPAQVQFVGAVNVFFLDGFALAADFSA